MQIISPADKAENHGTLTPSKICNRCLDLRRKTTLNFPIGGRRATKIVGGAMLAFGAAGTALTACSTLAQTGHDHTEAGYTSNETARPVYYCIKRMAPLCAETDMEGNIIGQEYCPLRPDERIGRNGVLEVPCNKLNPDFFKPYFHLKPRGFA
ncbi:MAG: hypothetical protein KGI97_08390, partial [Alphaproteobacteria bacterium]|nr:hypothetical protein [Alphaproteobacteria bacterium]